MSSGKLVFRCHQVSWSSDVIRFAAFGSLQVSRLWKSSGKPHSDVFMFAAFRCLHVCRIQMSSCLPHSDVFMFAAFRCLHVCRLWMSSGKPLFRFLHRCRIQMSSGKLLFGCLRRCRPQMSSGKLLFGCLHRCRIQMSSSCLPPLDVFSCLLLFRCQISWSPSQMPHSDVIQPIIEDGVLQIQNGSRAYVLVEWSLSVSGFLRILALSPNRFFVSGSSCVIFSSISHNQFSSL